MSIEKPIRKLGIAAIMLASSLTVMVGNAIAPALPDLGEVYHLGNYASWLVTAPALGVVSTAVFFGKLIDKKGPYPVALFGLLFYGILGVLGAYMPNAPALFADRFLLGTATAAIMSAGVALIAVFFQGEQQLKIIAVQGMSMEFGGVIFLSISGMLADISWKSPFYIYSLGILALVLLLCCRLSSVLSLRLCCGPVDCSNFCRNRIRMFYSPVQQPHRQQKHAAEQRNQHQLLHHGHVFRSISICPSSVSLFWSNAVPCSCYNRNGSRFMYHASHERILKNFQIKFL